MLNLLIYLISTPLGTIGIGTRALVCTMDSATPRIIQKFIILVLERAKTAE